MLYMQAETDYFRQQHLLCFLYGEERKREATAKGNQGPETGKRQEDEGRDPTNAGKVDCRANMKVVIDFAKYPDLLKQLQEVSDDQIRPIESQIIFFLKSIILRFLYGEERKREATAKGNQGPETGKRQEDEGRPDQCRESRL